MLKTNLNAASQDGSLWIQALSMSQSRPTISKYRSTQQLLIGSQVTLLTLGHTKMISSYSTENFTFVHVVLHTGVRSHGVLLASRQFVAKTSPRKSGSSSHSNQQRLINSPFLLNCLSFCLILFYLIMHRKAFFKQIMQEMYCFTIFLDTVFVIK